MRISDLTGSVFGYLTVIERAERVRRKARWRCRCRCGAEKIVYAHNLNAGLSKSCGCLRGEKCRTVGKNNFRHGHTVDGKMSRTFACWHNIIDRCKNPKSRAYRHYGGRGIDVCARWAVFDNFLADMGEMPPRAQIDRVNNDGDYAPSNCRWATSKENANNRRSNVKITFDGITRTIAQWAEFLGVERAMLYRCANRRNIIAKLVATQAARQEPIVDADDDVY